MKKIFYTALIASFAFLDANAQQDPHYTQYMYNMSVVNPAYAGSKESLSGGLLYRKQWVEIEDAPSTGTFFIHSPVGKNVGLGISFINDQIGPVEENNVYADFSYTLNLGGEHKLAFGVKGGATFQNVGLLDINPTLPNQGTKRFRAMPQQHLFECRCGILYYYQ
jgi:type IX secretion system PorP/SprF family membrane protein